jgi:hypothetical protein
MPKFIISCEWTTQGFGGVATGDFLRIRQEAIDFASVEGLKNIHIVDRLFPVPLGPIWEVEGAESAVQTVVARFNIWGNVRAQYHHQLDGIRDKEQIQNLVMKLVRPPPFKP